MNEKITHSGIVDSIDGDRMRVRIRQNSACGDCRAASFCNAAESKEKLIDVYGRKAMGGHKVGDNVVIATSGSVGRKAVMIGFGFPLVLLIVALAITYTISHSEPLSALMSIAVLVPYYIVVYIMRGKLRHSFSFIVER